MKRLLLILILAALLCGCQREQVEEVIPTFTLSQEKQEFYEAMIDETLNHFYWYYDRDTIDYYSGNVPSNTTGNEELFAASEINGYNLSDHSEKEAVIYEMDLIHFNGSKAGSAIFYFIKDDLVGLYYLSDFAGERAFDFETRNVFSKDAVFSNYESEEIYNTYNKSYSYIIPEGFCDEKEDSQGRKVYLAIEEETLVIYRFSGSSFTKLRTITNFGEGMVPVSASFVNEDEIGVIVGEAVEMEEDEHLHRIITEKVIFFDGNYVLSDFEFQLPKSSYSCIKGHKNSIILINERDMEEYEKTDEGLVLKKTYNTKVAATDIKIVDLDGDRIDEYLMTTGNDFYLFQMVNGSLQCVWNTNISTEYYIGNIYTGDLNKDSVKEIYISDYSGTTIRYTLNEKGLVVKNEDINYGEYMIVSDFNNDGIDDYILIEGIDTPVKTLFLGR